MKPLTIVNFSHPMKEELQIDIMRGLGTEPKRLTMQPGDPEVLTNLVYCEVKSQFDLEKPLTHQVQALLDGEEAAAWIRGAAAQNIVWVLPRLTEAAAVLVAELLDRVPARHSVRVVRLVQDRNAAVTVFKLAEIITLREAATETPSGDDAPAKRNPFMPPSGGATKPKADTAPTKIRSAPAPDQVKIPAKANYESQSGKELIYLIGADTPVLGKGDYKVIDGYRAVETQKTTGKYLHRIIQLAPDASSRVLLAIAPQGGRVEIEGVNQYAAIMGKAGPYRLVCSAGLQLNGEFICWNIPADKPSKMIMRGYKSRRVYVEATI